MSTGTGIEWTEATWNPVTGCDRVSEGCDNCYALTLAKRLKAMGNPRYQQDGKPRTSGPGFGVTLHVDKLGEPMQWRRPRMVFVNSMSDLFHDEIPDEFVRKVFGVMREADRHTFQVLTKRPGRMASLLRRWHETDGYVLPNVWLGVSVENQRWADIRIPKLLDTPAAVRFLSCEPLLGPLDLREWLHPFYPELDWVIVGGESGPHARPMHPDWARSIGDQCVAARVPFFFKQWGAWTPDAAADPQPVLDTEGHEYRARIRWVGGHGGRELDGRTWGDMPEVVTSAHGGTEMF